MEKELTYIVFCLCRYLCPTNPILNFLKPIECHEWELAILPFFRVCFSGEGILADEKEDQRIRQARSSAEDNRMSLIRGRLDD